MNAVPHTPLLAPALRGFLAALGGDLVRKIIGIATTLITLHELSAYQYGLWQLILSVAVGFGTITFPGIAEMLVADVSRELGAGNRRRAHGIIIRSVTLFLSTSIIGALAMAIAAPFIKSASGINITTLLWFMSFSVAMIGCKQVYQLLFRSHLQFVHAQTMKIIDRTAYAVAIFYFLIIADQGFDGVVYAYVLSSAAAVVAYAPYIFGMLRESFRDHEHGEWRPFFEAVWVRGKFALASDGVNASIGSLWPWLVGYFLGLEALGAISVALMLHSQASAFIPISYMLRSVLPRTAHSVDRMKEWLARSMKMSAWGHLLAGGLAYAASALIFPFWFPQHIAALPIFLALVITLPLRGVSVVASEWFYATGKQKELFYVSSLAKLFTFALMPVFLALGGVLGYVLWNFFSTDVILYARMRKILKELGTKIPLSFFFTFDAVDRDLLRRVGQLIVVKIRSQLKRKAAGGEL